MKAVLISIRPQWCELIASGKKTVEVRKIRPKLETPFKCYIYETMDEDYKARAIQFHRDGRLCGFVNYPGQVIGEFVCDRIDHYLKIGSFPDFHFRGSRFEDVDYEALGMTELEMLDYDGRYGWHISDLKIYDRPRELCDFTRRCPAYGTDVGRCWECLMAVGDEHDCGANGLLYVERPPQSWCYVEEVEL